MNRILGLTVCSSALIALWFGFAAPGEAQDEAKWGDVKGRVIWKSKEIPEQVKIDAVDKSPDKNACCKDGPVLSEKWVVNKKNKGLKWTFVWLEPVAAGGKMPIHPSLQKIERKDIEIDQPTCMFNPHAVGMREGQVLLAKNSSAIGHNFKWAGNPSTANAGGNVLIAAKGEVPIKGLVADRMPVKVECNIHSWMGGWVRVFDHPYFAVTDADGNFEFKNAPAGEYRMKVWHGSGGWLGGASGKNGQVITIPAGKTHDAGELKYQPPSDD